jgi:hypothetical protein
LDTKIPQWFDKIEPLLVSASGKITQLRTHLLSPSTKTVKLRTGTESGYLTLDVDNPRSETNNLLLQYLSRDDFIVYSSEFTLDDVFFGKCRYKVVYKHNQKKDIPKSKRVDQKFKDVEIFYNKGNHCLVAIAGKRDDGYEYLFTPNTIKELPFDLYDIYNEQVGNFKFGEDSERVKKKEAERGIENPPVQTQPSKITEELEGAEDVDIDGFALMVGKFINTIPIIEKKGTLLTFPCLFGEVHSAKNQAYSWKKNGIYQARCFGEVCSHEYVELNKKIKEYQTTSLEFDVKGFEGLRDKGINLFIAGVGWGKTEKIAQEALLAVQNKKKLLILLQSKEAIERLMQRIDYYSNGRRELLEETGNIFVYIAENKTEDFAEDVDKANVIISHHDYFKSAGGVITYFKSSWTVLEQPNLEIIVDEAHTYLEKATRLDLEIGGAYYKSMFDEKTWFSNTSSLTREEFEENSKYDVKTRCVEARFSEFGTIEVVKQYKFYETVNYLDVYGEIQDKFPKIREFVENNYKYQIFRNPHPIPIRPNNLEGTTHALDLLLGSAEDIVIGINIGDDIKRKKIGNITASIYHSQIIKRLLNSAKRIVFASATVDNYHIDLLRKHSDDIHIREVSEKVDKVGNIVLLKANDSKPSRPRKALLETTADVDARCLFFFPTIDYCKKVLDQYSHTMMNDNGRYVIGKRKSQDDFVDNIYRNVTVVGLEASPSKGYNYLEEVDLDAKGFELIYFDQSPVSPQIIKKYFNPEGDLQDYKSDYDISTFSQAIGRAFRKKKQTLCLALNNIDEETYEMIKEHLEVSTTARILEDTLNVSNLKVSLDSWVKQQGIATLKQRLRNNKLFRELYLRGEFEYE